MSASNDVFRRQDSLRLSQVSIPESQLIGSILSDTAHTKAPTDPEKSSPSHTDSQLKMPAAVSGIPPTLHHGFLRSTSAPPQLSVDPHGFGSASTAIFMNGESVLPDDPRLTPAYYAYYYSQRPLDPRLPPPLLDYSTWSDAPDQQQQSVAAQDDQNASHGPANEFISQNTFRQVLHQPKPMPVSSFEVGFESLARSWSEKTPAPATKTSVENPQGFAGPLGMIQQDFPRTPSPLFPSEQPTEPIDSLNFNLNGNDANNYTPESFKPATPLRAADQHDVSDNVSIPELQQQMKSMRLASSNSAPSQSRPRAFETQPQAQAQLDSGQQQFQTPQTSQSGLVFPSNAMFAPAPMAPYRSLSGVSPMIAVMGYGQGQKANAVRQRQQQQQQQQQLHHHQQQQQHLQQQQQQQQPKSRMMPLHSAMFGVQQQQQQQRLMQNQQQQSYQEYISPHQRPTMSHSQSYGVQQHQQHQHQQLDNVPPQAVGFRQRSTPQQYWTPAPAYHSMPSQPQQQHYGHQHQQHHQLQQQQQQYVQSQRMQQQQQQQWYRQAQQQQQPRSKGSRRYTSQQAPQKHPRDGVSVSVSGVSGGGGGGTSRSLVLHELRTNKHNHCVRLEDVLAQHLVSDLATDQNGSRFIQQQLESSTDSQKQALFEQLQPDTIRLCVDVFGNYVIQKFFEFGLPSQRRLLADQLRGNVLSLSLQMYGCRVVQKAIEMVDEQQQSELVQELNAHVIQCIKDQNGNHVIQKCIEQIPPHHIAFIIDAFVGHVFSLSTHAYGCRVVQRLLENCKGDAKVNSLILGEIMEKALQLVVDQYGNYVIQHVIQRGEPAHRSSVIHQIKGRIGELSKHKFASNVIEKCFAFANDEDKEALVNEVIGSDKLCPLASMVKDQYANYVVQKILGVVETTQRDRLIETIRTSVPNLRKIAFGKHIVARVEKLTGKVIS